MSFVERITISEDEWERRDIEVLKGRIDRLSKAMAVLYDFENLNCCVSEDREAVETAMWAMKEMINRYNGEIADMRGEE